MKVLLERALESLALMVFLIYIQVVGMATRADWLLPYLLASGLGLGATIYLLWRKTLLNRLLLGITLYFCSGLLGLTLEWDWLNNLYGELGAVAMLIWILLTGVAALWLSPYGFLAVKAPGYLSKTQGSILLLLACALAILVASCFIHNKLLGEWLPFIFLFSMRSLLLRLDRKQFTAAANAG